MYFSNNSRCVLRKVRFLSPSILNKIEKNLSVKKPKDDPTKPPLRINIPDESPEKDDRSNFLRKSNRSNEIRSPGASLSASYQDDVFRKTKSEITFSDVDGMFVNSQGEPQSKELDHQYYNRKESQASDGVSYDVKNLSVEKSSNLDLKANASEGASFKKVSHDNITLGSSKTPGKSEKNEAITAENRLEEPDNNKTWYILVDVHSDNKISEVRDETGPAGEGYTANLSWNEKNDFDGLPKAKDKKDIETSQKGKHISKFQLNKLSGKPRFEVSEVEDEATYILYLRLNKQMQGKSCEVGCVPEKEFITRNEENRDQEDLINNNSELKKNSMREHANLQRYSHERKKDNSLKTESDLLAGNTTPQPEAEDSLSVAAQRFRNFHQKDFYPVDQNQEEGRHLQRFTRHNFGNVTTPWRKFRNSEEDDIAKTTTEPLADSEEVHANAESNPSFEQKNETAKVEPLAAVTGFRSTTHFQNKENVFPRLRKTNKAVKDSDVVCWGSGKAVTRQPSERTQKASDESVHEKGSPPRIEELDEIRQHRRERQASGRKPNYKLSESEPHFETLTDSQSKTSERISKKKSKAEVAEAKIVKQAILEAPNELAETQITTEEEATVTQDSEENALDVKMKERLEEDEEKKYMSIHDTTDIPSQKASVKKPTNLWRASGREKPQVENSDNEATDFQTSTGFVNIGRTDVPSYPMKFGAAFPPLLKEALTTQLRLKKSFDEKWKKFEIWSRHEDSKSSHPSKVNELSENSILFPKKESKGFDCEDWFSAKDQNILNIIQNEEETCRKCNEKAGELGKEVDRGDVNSSIDSLAMMKKVKEMIQLDLDNVVKIFNNGEERWGKELSSVVMAKDNGWEVNLEELELQMAMRRNEMKLENLIDSSINNAPSKQDASKDGVNTYIPKYLPSKKETLTGIQIPGDQLKSVIMFNPKNNEFFICEKSLAEVIRKNINEELDEINQTLNILAESSKSSKTLKKGDSILVFDEETQSWKVDYSILEKRQQQLQLEEELTKRSELILETFEELEKRQLPTSIPKPGSKDKKTFDYINKEWKDYTEVKNPKEKSTKSKLPFKESNAEEIRKKNSDLYENLFVAKKKETKMSSTDKNSPSVSSSDSKKESKSAESGQRKEGSGSGAKSSGPGSKDPEIPDSKSKIPPLGKPVKKEDDNFWESFLKMNILPKDISEISKYQPAKTPLKPPLAPPITPSKAPPLTPSVTPPKAPPLTPPKSPPLTPPKSPPLTPPTTSPTVPTSKKLPVKDQEPSKPLLRIHIPFTRRLSIADKIKKNTEEELKKESTVKSPLPPPSIEKGDKPQVKAPPPPNQISKEEPKKTDPPKQPPKINPTKLDPPKLDPSKQPPKLDPPKSEPPKKPPKPDPPKQSPKLDPPKQPPKSDPPKQPPKIDPPQQPPKLSPTTDPSKPSQNTSGKIQDPKSQTGEKSASSANHYVSDKIIEISRIKGKDQKAKTNKIETVKLNITADQRLPSKVTEINLKKNFEKGKISTEAQKNSTLDGKPSDGNAKISEDKSTNKKPLHKKFEKYQTSFSDPDYEEKPMKIKSDIAGNPNLKKLDNWNKTLVLHDLMKPPENVENWLKDETDKMATLLLKILQEASDGKPKKKQLPLKPKSGDNQIGKGNPYEKIRKKQENNPESFLFRVRTVNLSLENDKKLKSPEDAKAPIKPKRQNELTVRSGKPSKTFKMKETVKLPVLGKESFVQSINPSLKGYQLPASLEDRKNRTISWGVENVGDFIPMTKEFPGSMKIQTDITEEIPGPEILKKISNTWKILPVLDSQVTIFTLFRVFQLVNLGRSFLSPSTAERMRKNAFTKLFSKYGPIVNVKGPLSGNVILIHKPEHLAAVFDQDVPMFVRSVFDSVEQIRKDLDEKPLSSDLSTNWASPEWADMKTVMNDSSVKGSQKYLVSAESTVDSLIGTIRKNRNSQNLVSTDFIEEIKRWSLEGLWSVLFEKSFGFMEGRLPNTNWVMEPDKLFMAVEKATHCLNKCEAGFQLWRLMPTPSAAGLSHAYRTISSILQKQIYQAGLNLKNKNELLKDGSWFNTRDLTLVESMMLNDGLSNEDITCNLIDILLIGTNLINSTIGFLLYNVASNVKTQNKVFVELKEVLPNKTTHLDFNKLASLRYLQACIKENLRLHVPIPLFYRLLQNDILLANYIVPKGTYIVMDQRTSNEKEHVFEEPQKFLPERWLSEDKNANDLQPFASFPLCHGPRAEFSKKIIELQLLICAAKILRNFQVEYQYGEIQSSNSLINFPDKPLKLNFIERET